MAADAADVAAADEPRFNTPLPFYKRGRGIKIPFITQILFFQSIDPIVHEILGGGATVARFKPIPAAKFQINRANIQ